MSSQLSSFMRTQVEEWRRSGMSMKSYAQKQGVTRHKFEYWVRKFRLESSSEGGHQFVQLTPSNKVLPVRHEEGALVGSAQPQMELTFPGGTCLKIYL